MPLARPQGLLFDLGDTIVTQVEYNQRAGIEAVLGVSSFPADLAVDTIERVVEEIQQELRPRRELNNFEFPFQSIQRLVFDRLGIESTLSAVEIEKAFYLTAVREEPEPGVRDTLERIQAMGLPLGVVSNSEICGEVLQAALARLDLHEYFRFLISSADYGIRKPHPLLLKTAAAKLGVSPSDVWFMGNLLDTDVAGARNSGMTAVWYRPSRENAEPLEVSSHQPDACVESWEQLLRLIQDSL